MATTKKKPSIPVITAKKKGDVTDVYNNERLVSKYDKKTVEKKKKETPAPITYPHIVKGSHLTVTTYENGKVELLWDDDALLRDVRNALAKVN